MQNNPLIASAVRDLARPMNNYEEGIRMRKLLAVVLLCLILKRGGRRTEPVKGNIPFRPDHQSPWYV